MDSHEITMEKIVSLCKRRGFVFQSSEIYGGQAGAWDYGPIGIELKKNIQNAWWKEMTQLHDNIVGLDAAILMHPRVWEASGHVANFSDPLVDCKQCKMRYRADTMDQDALAAKKCPSCGGELTEPRAFNLMFKTHIGPAEDTASIVYLRPETAQGIYVNYKNIVQSNRMKVPFGIAQVGKAFRNEIVTKNFIFRTCEFEQMEMQFFVKPGEDDKWFQYWRDQRWSFYKKYGIRMEKLRWYHHEKLAHYANAATDVEFQFPFGFKEVEGIHSRTDYDLSRHQQFSGRKIQYFDPESGESYVPYVVETSIGVDRMFLQIMSAAYDEETLEGGEQRVVLRIPAALAPVKIAVMPLVKKDGLPEVAREIVNKLKFDYMCQYDEKDSIGKRYRRQDAIGTPLCVTVDHQTLEDGMVTIRHRDSMQQERVKIEDLQQIVEAEVSMKKLFEKLMA